MTLITNYILLTLALIALAYGAILDVKDKEVDWKILALAILFSLVYALLKNNFLNLIYGLAVAIVIPLFLVLVSHERWMGWGDVLIASAVGLLCGFPNSIVALFASFLSASIFGIIYLSASRKKIIAFGPFLVLGCLVAILFSKAIITFCIDSFF